MAAPIQLVLPVVRRAAPSLDNFLGNREVVARLRGIAALPQYSRIWLIGGPGSGKTHLVGAVLNAARTAGHRVGEIVPRQAQPDDLRQLAGLDLAGIDGAEAIGGDPAWEAALLQLCNEQRGSIVFTAMRHPADAGVVLPDLRSRLVACEVYRLVGLSDPDRLALLGARAAALGIALPDDVARYLLVRLPRDAATLTAAIDGLDLASWRTQRRLTVPFVRDVLRDKP